MSPARPSSDDRGLDAAAVAKLDRALLSGDVAALHELSIPCPLAVLAGDISRLLDASSLAHDPLHVAVSELLGGPQPGASDDDASVTTYVAAVAVLNSFLRVNFAGPSFSAAERDAGNAETSRLAVDGEEAAAAVRNGHLLLAAEDVLVRRVDALVALGMPCARWWAARASLAHHLVLARPTATLHARIFGSFATLLGPESSALVTLRKNPRDAAGLERKCEEDGGFELSALGVGYESLEVLANIELCMAQQQFYDPTGALASLSRAKELLGIVVDVRGRMGVRTKFQRTPVSQLVARVYNAEVELPRDSVHGGNLQFPRLSDSGIFSLPRNVPLDDTDVLGYVKLTPEADPEEDDAQRFGKEVMDMTPAEQALILACASVELSRNADHTLTDEQAGPFVTRVLSSVESSHGSSSPLQIRAQLLRSRFERDRGRYMERNMTQLETIGGFIDATVDSGTSREPLADDPALLAACERLAFTFASGIPARWELKKELAISFGRLGLVKSAMEIFRELEFWDELVDCHRLIGDIGAAEELVRGQLASLEEAEGDTSGGVAATGRASSDRSSRRPRLLCVLGDVTRNPALYEKAWIESGKRCGRAKRSLGRFAVERGEWSSAVSHLREALRLNPLMPDVWFTCGCACIEDEDMYFAAVCFTHVVQETPDNGEAWNNLGRVLCETDRKREGLSALLQAARCKRESWRIWDNVLTVATSLKSSDDIILAMGRLIELRGKDAVSAAPLLIAVEEVVDSVNESGKEGLTAPESEGSAGTHCSDATRMCRSLLQLLGRVTALVSSDPLIWAAYARLHDLIPGKESRRKSAECRQRQIRTLMADSTWKGEERAFQAMAVASLAFANVSVDSEDDSLVYAAQLHVDSVILQTKEHLGASEHFLLLTDAEKILSGHTVSMQNPTKAVS